MENKILIEIEAVLRALAYFDNDVPEDCQLEFKVEKEKVLYYWLKPNDGLQGDEDPRFSNENNYVALDGHFRYAKNKLTEDLIDVLNHVNSTL